MVPNGIMIKTDHEEGDFSLYPSPLWDTTDWLLVLHRSKWAVCTFSKPFKSVSIRSIASYESDGSLLISLQFYKISL